jgi:SulP family sulfate permease
LVDLSAIRHTWRYSKSDFASMVTTIIVTLALGVELGVVSGVIVSILIYLWRTSRPHVAVVGRVPGTEHFRNIQRHAVEVSDTVLSIRVDESLYFANARFLEDTVYRLVSENSKVVHLVLLCSAINEIDGSALASLEAINQHLHEAGVTLHLSEVKGPVLDRLRCSDFFDHLSGQVYLTQHEAIGSLEAGALHEA